MSLKSRQKERTLPFSDTPERAENVLQRRPVCQIAKRREKCARETRILTRRITMICEDVSGRMLETFRPGRKEDTKLFSSDLKNRKHSDPNFAIDTKQRGPSGNDRCREKARNSPVSSDISTSIVVSVKLLRNMANSSDNDKTHINDIHMARPPKPRSRLCTFDYPIGVLIWTSLNQRNIFCDNLTPKPLRGRTTIIAAYLPRQHCRNSTLTTLTNIHARAIKREYTKILDTKY